MDDDEIKQPLILDGSAYSLTAARTTGGFHSAWSCDTCGDTGYCQVHNTADDALAVAEHAAKRHHGNRHHATPI